MPFYHYCTVTQKADIINKVRRPLAHTVTTIVFELVTESRKGREKQPNAEEKKLRKISNPLPPFKNKCLLLLKRLFLLVACSYHATSLRVCRHVERLAERASMGSSQEV